MTKDELAAAVERAATIFDSASKGKFVPWNDADAALLSALAKMLWESKRAYAEYDEDFMVDVFLPRPTFPDSKVRPVLVLPLPEEGRNE